MLKSKKAIYLLLPLVLIVWGFIFYKVFEGFSDGNEDTVLYSQKTTMLHIEAIEPDAFSILADYRDPFLGKIARKKLIVKKVKRPIKVVKKPPKIIKWPSVTYGGMVKNQQSLKVVAMVKISGKEKLMKAGEELNGIQLVRIYRDSIEVKYEDENKMIFK